MNVKLISIIVATYNADKTIEHCLDSIIPQKNDQVELLIIDGKSKDNTMKIVQKYQEYIDVLISETDKGIYDAWNKGIKLASGRWIMFIGADDCLKEDALQNYLEFLKLHDCDLVDYISARNEYIDSKGNRLMVLGEPYSWRRFRKYMCVAHVASLHNARLFQEVGYYDLNYRICADYELLMRKKNLLKVLFFNTIIAQMKAGGMSLSFEAIYETMKIRKLYSSLNPFINMYLTVRGFILVIWKRYLTKSWR